ncbi:PAS domain S-box protein [Geomonas sp.]|uniref:PAS domain-containing protein n=1 Tax=Geomonas sp. TaxID=2651584 RepID=UPI002B46FB02|nr:PAS domain S-box protein [Geomonas sp.]HJV33789.1 PAS domain S-box protein [Geomonas sp.]
MKQYEKMSREELLREVHSLHRQNNVIQMTQQVALRESEDRYRRMIETANEGVWVLDAKGFTTFVNEKLGVMLGYHPEEMLGRHLFDFMDEESRKLAEEKLTLRSRGVKDVFDFRFRSKEGRDVWTILGTTPIYDHDNLYVGSLAMITDITDRKRAEEALRESEARYRAMVQAFPGFTYICSQQLRIEFLNDRFKELLGRDATGEECFAALHERDSICPWCVNDRVAAGEHVQWEVKSPRDGRWYQVSNTPIHNADGSVSKHALILDITSRKVAEEELERQRSMLGQASALLQFGTWSWEAASDSFTFCRQGSKVLGTDKDSVPLQEWLDLAHPEDRPNMQQAVREAADGAPCDIVFRPVSVKKGDTHRLRMLGKLVMDAENQPSYLCGIVVAVTQ